jgi:hypothetical protein
VHGQLAALDPLLGDRLADQHLGELRARSGSESALAGAGPGRSSPTVLERNRDYG